MLTVKWIYEVDGGEAVRIFQASEVGAAFRDASKELKCGGPGEAVMNWGGRDVHRSLFIVGFPFTLDATSLNHGKVYVMNDAGKTVASYDLGKEPPVCGGVAPGDVPKAA